MSVGFRMVEKRNMCPKGGFSLRRGGLYMCEPDFDDSSMVDSYVLGGAFEEVVWVAEGAGAISD